MEVFVHRAVFEGEDGGALVGGMGGGEVVQVPCEADADFEGIHFGDCVSVGGGRGRWDALSLVC